MNAEPLLQQTNPYGSHHAVVEDDGRSVYLYLLSGGPDDPDRTMSAVWVANRVPAPEADDRASMEDGRPPLMPRTSTRCPEGRAGWGASDLRLVWFEEGDGVALIDRSGPVAVIPPWSGHEGCNGYSRDAVGQHSLAWPLDADALTGLGPRIEQARDYWRWRANGDSWQEIQAAGLGYLEGRLGPHQRYWAADGGEFPPRAVAAFAPAQFPGISVCATVGMSAQAMPQVEMYFEDPAPYRRIELVLATRSEPGKRAGVLSMLMGSPWKTGTWLGDGHTYSWGAPSAIPGETAVLLRREPLPLTPGAGLLRRAVPPPSLAPRQDRRGDPITYLWVLPITGAECELAQTHGTAALMHELQRQKRSCLWE